MPGLVPDIHELPFRRVQVVDTRDKPGHDGPRRAAPLVYCSDLHPRSASFEARCRTMLTHRRALGPQDEEGGEWHQQQAAVRAIASSHGPAIRHPPHPEVRATASLEGRTAPIQGARASGFRQSAVNGRTGRRLHEKAARIAPDGLLSCGLSRVRQFHLPMAVERFSETLSRKPVVESHFWSAPMSRARSLVM